MLSRVPERQCPDHLNKSLPQKYQYFLGIELLFLAEDQEEWPLQLSYRIKETIDNFNSRIDLILTYSANRGSGFRI